MDFTYQLYDEFGYHLFFYFNSFWPMRGNTYPEVVIALMVFRIMVLVSFCSFCVKCCDGECVQNKMVICCIYWYRFLFTSKWVLTYINSGVTFYTEIQFIFFDLILVRYRKYLNNKFQGFPCFIFWFSTSRWSYWQYLRYTSIYK